MLGLVAVPAAQAQPLRFGLNDHILNHPEGPEQILDYHQQLGATVHRADLPWRSVQPQRGVWDWGFVDEVIGRVERRGMGTIALIGSVPPWAAAEGFRSGCLFDPYSRSCQPPPAPENIRDLQTFAQELARRYPSLVAIEVFNEPNLGGFNWQPAADPEYYTRVLGAVHDAVRQVRPELPVMSGGLGEPGQPRPAGSMDPRWFLERMYRAGARGRMDGIGLHPYPAGTSPEDPATSVYHRLMTDVREIRDRYGDAVPVWVTETGYTTTGPFAVTPEQQAVWLPVIVRDAATRPDVAAVVVHTLRDREGDPEDAEVGYGLLYTALTRKPVFDALAHAVRGIPTTEPGAARPMSTKRSSGRLRRCTRRSCCRRGSRSRRCRRLRQTPRDQLATTRE